MEISDTVETTLSWFQRLMNVGYYVIGALIGVFMILWGIFFNGWDWVLIGAGGAVFLVLGWYSYRALTG